MKPSGYMGDKECEFQKPFVCEIDCSLPAPPCTAPPGYIWMQGKYYKKYPANNYNQAIATCHGEGATLPIFTNEDDFKTLKSLRGEWLNGVGVVNSVCVPKKGDLMPDFDPRKYNINYPMGPRGVLLLTKQSVWRWHALFFQISSKKSCLKESMWFHYHCRPCSLRGQGHVDWFAES